MPQTYTSGTLSVSDGEITSHDTTTVAEGITILSAECRWQGVETTEQETNYDYATNTNSDTATATTSTTTSSTTNSDSGGSGAGINIPAPPSGYSFLHHSWQITISNSASVEQTATGAYDYPGGTNTFSKTLAAGATVTVEEVANTATNHVGADLSLAFDSGGGRSNSTIACDVSATTVGEDTLVNNQTATASYPAVPSGYSFDNHRYQEWSGGTEVGDEYFYYNKVGQSVSAVSSDPNTTVEVQLETQGVDSNTYTVTKDTHDPFVTRDVDGAYTGTLDDGEWSSWVTLNGLSRGVNEFYHNISGSGEAQFEFRYDWEYKYPEPVGGLLSIGSRDGSQLHRVALADPASDRLAYNHVRALVGGTAYAIDVVDPSDPDAIDWLRLGTQHGIVCPRAYQTESA